jgi:hypothetical protein
MRDVWYQVVFYIFHYDTHGIDVIVFELLHKCNVLRFLLFSFFKLWFHNLSFHNNQNFILGKDEINTCLYSLKLEATSVGRLIVVIDVNPSHGFWTARLIKVFGHEGKCTCIYNTHEWIVYIMLFPVVCGMSHGSSWLRRNEFLKMTM